MPMFCCVCKGAATSVTKDANITFHRFPLKTNQLCDNWLQKISQNQGKELTGNLANLRICSKHFAPTCFIESNRGLKLVSGSIPTIFKKPTIECIHCGLFTTPVADRTFHRFPVKNATISDKWKAAIGENVANAADVTADTFLCSKHFEQSLFYMHGKNKKYCRLRDQAVPTIFSREQMQETGTRMDPYADAAQCNTVESSDEPHEITDVSANIFLSETQNATRMDPYDDALQCNSTESIDEHAVMDDTDETGVPQSDVMLAASQLQETSSSRQRSEHNYANSPQVLLKKYEALKKKYKALQNKLRLKDRQVGRMKKRRTTMTGMIAELRKSTNISSAGLLCLQSIPDDGVSQFLSRFRGNQAQQTFPNTSCKRRVFKNRRHRMTTVARVSRVQYPPAIRAFALTLHFYSPKAYAFIRRKFCNALPEPRTLRAWYMSQNCEPGFTGESFSALERKAFEAKKEGKTVLVTFMLDEMSIKKGFQQLSDGSVRGYVDIGGQLNKSVSMPLAKEALVLMVVALDSSWKIPVGYFLTDGMESATLSGLVTEALIRLHEVDVTVISVTLDGTAGHFACMKSLGASFEVQNPQPFFPHPSTQRKVYVIFDGCHILKLIRNCLGDYKQMKDPDGNLIDWKYICALVQLQDDEGLRAGNKMRQAHVQYWKSKMKVALAAQTFSSSVADAIEFCARDLCLPQFQGSEATIRFIRCVDLIFDFLNSRNPVGKGQKAPLRIDNESKWRPAILNEIQYLQGIKNVEGRSMHQSLRRVGFVGFITAVPAVLAIFDEYVKPEGSQVKYLLTYKLSQDHLELFFGAVRRCGGWCPNPTCTQFVSAYRRLLTRHEIEASNGNVEAMDATNILCNSSGLSRRNKPDFYDLSTYDAVENDAVATKYLHGSQEDSEVHVLLEFLDFHNKYEESLSDFSKACVQHIAGWIVRKLTDSSNPKVHCHECRESLIQQSMVSQDTNDGLIAAKTRGGLIFPSLSVGTICQIGEEAIRRAMNRNNNLPIPENNFPAVLCDYMIQMSLEHPNSLFPLLHCSDDCDHKLFLIKTVCKAFVKLRLFEYVKIASDTVVGSKIRSYLSRQIIWKNQ